MAIESLDYKKQEEFSNLKNCTLQKPSESG